MTYTFNAEKHLHLLGEQPLTGTSSVVSMLNKPGLTWWASGQAMSRMGWTPTKTKKDERLDAADKNLKEIKTLGATEYLKLLDEAYRAHTVKLDSAAQDGTDLHAELEAAIKDIIASKTFSIKNEKVEWFLEWSDTKENKLNFFGSEVHTFSKEMYTGGIIDALALDQDNKIILLDFKSSKEVYPGHVIQAAGYALQVEEKGILTADGEQIREPFLLDEIIIIPFGAKKIDEEIKIIDDLGIWKSAFKSALNLYRIINNNFKAKED